MWMQLTDLYGQTFSHGTVFRLPAELPYEDVVDLMLFDNLDRVWPFGLVVTTGYKAGLIRVVLPAECVATDIGGLSAAWVIENWRHWIYPECPVEEVYALPHYPPGNLPVVEEA